MFKVHPDSDLITIVWDCSTLISCPMASMVDSRARVPRAASSSTVLTVFRREVTLVTITCNRHRHHHITNNTSHPWHIVQCIHNSSHTTCLTRPPHYSEFGYLFSDLLFKNIYSNVQSLKHNSLNGLFERSKFFEIQKSNRLDRCDENKTHLIIHKYQCLLIK